MHLLAHLSIGGKFHWLALFLRQAPRHLLHFAMFLDGSHGQTGRQQIQPPDALLEGGMQGRLAAEPPIGQTAAGAEPTRPVDEARKRWRRDARPTDLMGLHCSGTTRSSSRE